MKNRIQPSKKQINDIHLIALAEADQGLKGISSDVCRKVRQEVQIAISDLSADFTERKRQIIEKNETGHGKRVKLSKAKIFGKVRKAVEAAILALASVRSEQAIKTRERLVELQHMATEMYEKRAAAVAAKYGNK
jgi:hypothetical protein